MVAVVQSENSIGDASSTASAVAPGSIVGDWAGIDPWSILGVAIAGAVLLLFGARVLRPAVVLAASMLGAIGGLQLAGATREGSLPEIVQAMGVPPLAWVIGLPLVFGAVTLAVARLALAVLLGASVGSAVLLIGLAMVTQGRVIDGVTDSVEPASLRLMIQDEGDGFADHMTDRIVDTAVDRLLAEPPELSSLVPLGLVEWWREITVDVPPGTVDLVVALATVSGLCSGLLAMLLPARTAMVATSVCGGWLLSGTLVTAWVRWMPDAAPPTPFMTLLGWAVLTGLGVLYQSRARRRPSAESDRA